MQRDVSARLSLSVTGPATLVFSVVAAAGDVSHRPRSA